MEMLKKWWFWVTLALVVFAVYYAFKTGNISGMTVLN